MGFGAARVMWCLFIKQDHIVASREVLGRSDQEAIERSKLLFEEKRALCDTFEVWEGRRMVYQHPAPVPPTSESR